MTKAQEKMMEGVRHERDLIRQERDELLVEFNKVHQALCDLTDGESWWDLQASTGFSKERCIEIRELAWGTISDYERNRR